MLLSDEPIFVQDDNYFHTPATPLSPTQDPATNGGSNKGEGNIDNANGTGAASGAGVNVTTGIAAMGVSSVNSPTTGKIYTNVGTPLLTHYYFLG